MNEDDLFKKELMDAVDYLNEDYFEKTKNENDLPFAFVYCGWFYGITYLGDHNFIWSTENETRKYIDEEKDEYEPILDALKREIEKYNYVTFKGYIKFKRK